MKSLLLAIVIFMFSAIPIAAQDATVSASPSPSPAIMGLYDEDINSTGSASISATPTATPSARATTYLDTSNTPVSGSIENTIIILSLGILFIGVGIRFSKI